MFSLAFFLLQHFSTVKFCRIWREMDSLTCWQPSRREKLRTSRCDLEEALHQLCNSTVIFSFPGVISRDIWAPIKVKKQTFVCEQAINISVWGMKGGWLTNKWNTEELLMFTASTVETVESANIQFACGCNQERISSAAASSVIVIHSSWFSLDWVERKTLGCVVVYCLFCLFFRMWRVSE